MNELKVYCKCGEGFRIKGILEEHRKICCDENEKENLSVTDLLNIDLNKPLPETVERATLRIIQYKVDNSETGTAEFNSGGPRVIIILYSFTVCIKRMNNLKDLI